MSADLTSQSQKPTSLFIYDTIRFYCFRLEAGLHTVVEEYETEESKHNTNKQT